MQIAKYCVFHNNMSEQTTNGQLLTEMLNICKNVTHTELESQYQKPFNIFLTITSFHEAKIRYHYKQTTTTTN